MAKFWAWRLWERRLSKTVQAYPVADSGEGPGGPSPPPLIFRPNWSPKGPKKFFGDCSPTLSQGLNNRPPLSEGLASPLLSVHARAKQIGIVALPTCFDLGIAINFVLYFRSVTHFRRLLFSSFLPIQTLLITFWIDRKINSEYWFRVCNG